MHYSICDKYGVNADETGMNKDRFYKTKYGVFGDGGKTTERFPRDNLTRWIITQSEAFRRKCIIKER